MKKFRGFKIQKSLIKDNIEEYRLVSEKKITFQIIKGQRMEKPEGEKLVRIIKRI